MFLFDAPVISAALNWLSNGLLEFSWWEIVLYVLITTHITIASVTIFLHRSQAHRSVDPHPGAAHFFRFWLPTGTGMVTKDRLAIYRQHHAKREIEHDPLSPQTTGINAVLWRRA